MAARKTAQTKPAPEVVEAESVEAEVADAPEVVEAESGPKEPVRVPSVMGSTFAERAAANKELAKRRAEAKG